MTKIAIIGAGMMGQGIRRVFEKTCTVKMYDSRSGVDGTVPTITEAVSNADFVIEAVFEDLELKQNLFAEIEPLTKAVLCTNTSVMSITQIAEKLHDKSRLVGTHFWNPADLIPLVEVVRGQCTSDAVMDITYKLLQNVGKHPVRCQKDVPGFIANRLQHALWREAISMVENGICDAATVDEAVRFGPGLRWPVLGPMENADMVGLDLALSIHKYIFPSLENSSEPSQLLQSLVESGNHGFKTGTGFQSWTTEQAEDSRAKLKKYLQEVLK